MKTKDATPPPINKPRNGRRWVAHVLLILVVALIVHTWRTQPLATGLAPPLAGRLLHGGSIDLAQLRGETILIHFWATWCPMCRMGDKDIDNIAAEFHVVTVAMQSGGAREVAAYMASRGLNFPVILDEHGDLAADWGVVGVPASFVVDPQGEIRFATLGYTTQIGLRGRLWAAQ